MLRDRKRIVERMAANRRLRRQYVQEYGAFLRTLFSIGDWFVTLTFRDRHQDSDIELAKSKGRMALRNRKSTNRASRNEITICAPDPRLQAWEPASKNRPEPGPPVRDAALREIQHWIFELGWEAGGGKRQEIFDALAEGLDRNERRNLAKALCKRCLCCAVLNHPQLHCFYDEIRWVATETIGWVIAEEFGRAGGRWHVHILVRGVQQLRRRKWWRRAFVRFGRSRIEAIHE